MEFPKPNNREMVLAISEFSFENSDSENTELATNIYSTRNSFVSPSNISPSPVISGMYKTLRPALSSQSAWQISGHNSKTKHQTAPNSENGQNIEKTE